MRVKQLMSDNVVTIEATASSCEAVQRMTRYKIRHLPVVTAEGKLCGIVTDRDLRHHLFSREVFEKIGKISVDTLLKSVPVREVMSTPVVTVGPDEELEVAARLMLEDKVGSLPVVQEGRVVGMITETDLLRRVVGADAACAEADSIIISYP